MKEILKIEKHVTFFWEEKTKSVIVKWSHFFVKRHVFQDVVQKVLLFAKEYQAKAWIVDASEAESFINSNLMKEMTENIMLGLTEINIKFFFSIIPKKGAFAKVTEQRYKEKSKKLNIITLEVESVEDAISYLNKLKNKPAI